MAPSCFIPESIRADAAHAKPNHAILRTCCAGENHPSSAGLTCRIGSPPAPAGRSSPKLSATPSPASSPPAYCRFVLEMRSQIERAIGATLVHLMWLELCGQLQMAQAAVDPESLDALLQNPEVLIARSSPPGQRQMPNGRVDGETQGHQRRLECGKPILPALTPGPSPASGRAETAVLPRAATLLLPPLDPAHPGPRTLNPEPSPKLENRRTADQLSHPALELVASRPDLFSRQG